MSEAIFKDRSGPEPAADSLGEMPLTATGFLRRIFGQHLRRRWRLLALSFASMGVVALTTGILPFLIQRAADDVFVRQDTFMLFLLPVIVVAITASVVASPRRQVASGA